jgi:hypothetical protein
MVNSAIKEKRAKMPIKLDNFRPPEAFAFIELSFLSNNPCVRECTHFLCLSVTGGKTILKKQNLRFVRHKGTKFRKCKEKADTGQSKLNPAGTALRIF